MNQITFKVASKGEGKTKWLLNIAKQYSDENRKVYLLTDKGHEFSRFCEKYCNLFSEVCHVERLIDTCVTNEDVVLIDDIFTQNIPTSCIDDISRNCYKMFITVDGALDAESVHICSCCDQAYMNV